MRTGWKSWLAAGVLAGAATWLWQRGRERAQARKQAPPVDPLATRYGPWALVTGAARAEGIGFGFARRLAGKGINVVLVDILEEELAARAQELADKYLVKVRTAALDLGEPDFLDRLRAETGDLDVGLVVCNHMVTPPDTPAILDMDLATHHRMIDVNARAYTTLIHAYGRQLVARGRGGLIIVSSGAGLQATPYTGAYSANKAFQLKLGEALWYELQGTGVDVLVVAPGLTNTQGEALSGYPQFMVMDVNSLVVESLDALGKTPLLIPGRINKAFMAAQTRLMGHRQSLEFMGDFMARGLGKEQ